MRERQRKVGCRRKIRVFDKYCEYWQHFFAPVSPLFPATFRCAVLNCESMYWQSSPQKPANTSFVINVNAEDLKENYRARYEHVCYYILRKNSYLLRRMQLRT